MYCCLVVFWTRVRHFHEPVVLHSFVIFINACGKKTIVVVNSVKWLECSFFYLIEYLSFSNYGLLLSVLDSIDQ